MNRERKIILISLIALGFIAAFILVPRFLSPPKAVGKLTLAPDFFFTSLENVTYRLSDFRGKVVVIDFMTTWCPTCRNQIPNLKTIAEKYGDRIVLVSIGVDPTEPEEDLRTLAQQYRYPSWIWAKDKANLIQTYGISLIPKTTIIDKLGYVRFDHTGLQDASVLSQEIDSLLI